MAPPGDPGNSLESLRHQLAERVQQSAGKVQPPGTPNAPPVVNLSRAEIETQLAQARQANDIGTLVAVLRRAVAAFPDDEAYKLRLDRAVVAQQDEAADALIEQARRAETARRWDLASQKWSLAAEARPMDITVLLSTAAAILEHGQEHSKAAEFARRATQLNPSSARAHAMLSRIFHEAGRAASARASLETALRLDPSAPEVADMLRRINQR
jgi:cytochrome c-type biogenesis protein CcmH/NrfG